MAWAVFYSASAGDNYIFGNLIEVNDLSPGSKNETSAFYIGGGTIGGQFFNNQITTNVPAVWVASRYGGAKDTRIFKNQITKSQSAGNDFKAFRMGWAEWKGCVAENISFESNSIVGDVFSIDATDQPHSYSVCWTLSIRVADINGKVVKDAVVKILDKSGKEVVNQKTSCEGKIQVQLPEYSFSGAERVYSSPFTVFVGKKKQEITLNSNNEVTIKLPK